MQPFVVFDWICKQSPLPLCTAIKANDPLCYSRNLDLGSFLLFEPCNILLILATVLVDIVAICMTCIMIFNVKSKYTAIGRKEIVVFFYMYFSNVILELMLLSNIVPFGSSVYPVNCSQNCLVFRCSSNWVYQWNISLSRFEWFYWVSMGRRWN